MPLSSVADVYTELSPQSIVRKNQKETVTITGESESGDANAITEKVNKVLDSYETPDGVEIGDGDTMASQMAETTGSRSRSRSSTSSSRPSSTRSRCRSRSC